MVQSSTPLFAPKTSGDHADRFLAGLSPYVRSTHDFPTEAGFDLRPRVVSDHAFLYFKDGEGTFTVAGVDHPILPGTLFLIRPGVEHAVSPRSGSLYYMLNMHLDVVQRPGSDLLDGYQRPSAAYLRRIAPDILPDGPTGLPSVIRMPNPASYEHLFFRIHHHFAMRDPASRLRVKAGAIDLIAFLFAVGSRLDRRLGPTAEAVEAAARFIQEHASGRLGLAEIARQAAMSRSHFARSFKHHYQVSPMAYLRQVLIERAKMELMYDHRTIKHIAESLGYSTVHHFTRVFAEAVGMPPGAYREL
ncbi:MAG: helix-turn-helix transcriptional regulator, partial [Planctomycetes bacterium]|nr:helix-turn-helix transcriptional regulator [Planctomycetota bacterium]